MAHIKYRSRTKDRVVKVEASYGPAEIDRIALNAGKAGEELPVPAEAVSEDLQPSLLRRVVLTLQQANTGPAKEKGKTAEGHHRVGQQQASSGLLRKDPR